MTDKEATGSAAASTSSTTTTSTSNSNSHDAVASTTSPKPVNNTNTTPGEDDKNNKDERGEPPAKLFIGQIPKHINESDLRKYFDPFGYIQELVILKDKQTNTHKGCAFLTYTTKTSADKAIAALHEKISLHNRPLIVRYAGNTGETKLFVGMLARTTTEQTIEQLFNKYGSVKEVYLMRDQNNHSKGCAFVKLTSKEDAMTAIDQLHDTYQDEGAPRKLIVRIADSAKDKTMSRRNNMMANFNQFGGMNPYAPFGRGFGGMNMGMGMGMMGMGGMNMGMGGMAGLQGQGMQRPFQQGQFGNNPYGYQGQQGDFQQVSINTPAGFNGTNFQGGFGGHAGHTGFTGQPTHAPGQHDFGAIHKDGPQSDSVGPAGANLFVYNIPDSFTDTDLASMFTNFGNVISTKVFRDKQTGLSKGFGFVSYDSVPSAEKAIMALNGFHVGNKRLKVMVKTNKNEQGQRQSVNAGQPNVTGQPVVNGQPRFPGY